ncbi:MAG TPA: OB-fold domain-containing protein [Acidimicrobiia bacterium]|nr:OB-fold domain-containing protein [Acidimicrobiia bacterium]
MAERVNRPLPQLTPENEFFWTAGADGELRVQKCTACGALLHPPGPICPYCQSRSIEVTGVSGRATVVGFTVNHQQWLPDLPLPYVVAIVALDEDPRVRLTTNVVGADPDTVTIGMRVQVRFEQIADVWLPLFEPVPAGEPDREPWTPPEEHRPRTRPMPRRDKFEEKVALTGIGMSDIGRRLMRDPLSLTVDACLAAVADAGLDLTDIDGLSTYPGGMAMAGGHSEGGVPALEEALRIQPTWINGGMEIPGQSGAVVAAMLAVAAGLCRHVLCFRTVWESTSAALERAGRGGGHGGGRVGGEMQWRFPFGAMSAANWIAMNASLHFQRYGTTREALGRIALNARANAARNPTAVYRDPLTMDDYLSARMITTPFGLYDCDVPCDGSIAIVVSARDVARDLRQKPVFVDAVGTQITERWSWDQDTLSHEPMVLGPAAHLWTRTSLTPRDVDVAEVYDGFSFNCLSWLEALGFCGIGEGADFLGDGSRIALDGELPLNTHGGQLSAGRTHGFGFVHEAIVQLRGDGGDRQVPDAQVALVTTGGGTPGGCLLLTRG